MANAIYLALEGKEQGLISRGCCSIDSIGNKYQVNHTDQIYIYSVSHSITREQHSNHQPVIIQKPIDKASPLLGVAISDNEELECIFYFYRTNANGAQELYYTLKLTGAVITELASFHPHSINHHDSQPQETVSLAYKNIVWTHNIAGTSGYSIWDERVR